jgi:hypothetical protein
VRGYDRTGDKWEPITHLQGYDGMVKVFKESHENDVERLTTDRRCEDEGQDTDGGQHLMWSTRKYVENSQLYTECIQLCETI